MHVYLMTISAHVADNTGSLALAVPLLTVVVLLDPTQSPLNPAHDKAISLVLGWATAIPVAFKEVMKLDQGVREVLEGSIRLAVAGGPGQTSAAQPDAKKQMISLKAFWNVPSSPCTSNP